MKFFNFKSKNSNLPHYALGDMEGLFDETSITKGMAEMIRLRASHFNHCSSCTGLYLSRAVTLGVDKRKLLALSEWWKSPLFSMKEKAVLAVTDDLMKKGDHGLKTEHLELLQKFMSKKEIAKIVLMIDTLKVWNHMTVSTHNHQ